jgi:hypothetical protein
MKSYDKIEYWNKGKFGENCIAFDKLDGNNLRFEWGHKRGFYKFGSRTVMIDKNDENFSQCIPMFLEKYDESLNRVFSKKYRVVRNFVIFCEYWGKNSFAGKHEPGDDMDITLIDVSVYKRGIISPFEFVDNFGELGISNIVYQGEYNNELIHKVRTDEFGLQEGVVCKGVIKTRKEKDAIWMAKIKTNKWLTKIKEKLGEKALLEELNNDKELLI